MKCKPSSASKGFTLIEILVALGLLGLLTILVLLSLTGSLKVKNKESARVNLQQNLRGAMHILAQDVREAAQLHIWNENSCAGKACSRHDRVALVVINGEFTRVPMPPGNSFTNAATTFVCDASQFQPGDLALLVNDDQVELLPVTQVMHTRNPNQPCRGPNNPPTNADKLQHNTKRISGQWNPNASIFKAEVINYLVMQDRAGDSVLCRIPGLHPDSSRPCEDVGQVVAFDVQGFEVQYGIPTNPSNANAKLTFLNNPTAAASSLQSYGPYSPYPSAGQYYVGRVMKALRLKLIGQNNKETQSLIQTVEFRR